MDEMLAGRFRLGPVLGRGGMGTVRRAHDRRLDRDVAVKLLEVAGTPEVALERFRREAQFLAGLAHPNIVTVFDFGTDDSHAWLVMELLAGPTLQDLVNQRGPLPIADAARYGRECAAALAAAHAAGITHRDVKPANLMLAADGTCKLLDLGIARLDGATATQPALTRTGTVLGTVPYLAPEVITGGAPEPPSDMYALGGVLFALLTGRPPFQGEDVMAAMAQHVHAPVPQPSTVRPDVPPGLDGLVTALLAKDPAQRPTAAEVVSRLGGPLDVDPAPTVALPGVAAATTQVVTPPPSVPPSPRRRPRAGVIAACVAVALALLVAVLVLANAGSDTAGRSANGPATSTSKPTSKPTSTAGTTHPRPSRSSSTTPAPTTLSGALAALRSAVTNAEASGALDPKDAQDLLHRVDAMTAALTGSGPGPGPGHGPGHGHGHGHGDGDGNGPGQNGQGGGTPDLTPMVDDFAHRLDDLRSRGALAGSAYSSISSALDAVRSLGGPGSD